MKKITIIRMLVCTTFVCSMSRLHASIFDTVGELYSSISGTVKGVFFKGVEEVETADLLMFGGNNAPSGVAYYIAQLKDGRAPGKILSEKLEVPFLKEGVPLQEKKYMPDSLRNPGRVLDYDDQVDEPEGPGRIDPADGLPGRPFWRCIKKRTWYCAAGICGIAAWGTRKLIVRRRKRILAQALKRKALEKKRSWIRRLFWRG